MCTRLALRVDSLQKHTLGFRVLGLGSRFRVGSHS